jgi:hypothetical protein
LQLFIDTGAVKNLTTLSQLPEKNISNAAKTALKVLGEG